MRAANKADGSGERKLMGLYTLVAGVGFVTDASILHLGLALHIEPAFARAISLISAMQVTFLINGLLVFRCLERSRWPVQWAGYMVTNGFGNLCNYFVFVTLVSLHDRIWSNHWLGLVAGGLTAWAINYTSARLLVFYTRRALEPAPCQPSARASKPRRFNGWLADASKPRFPCWSKPAALHLNPWRPAP